MSSKNISPKLPKINFDVPTMHFNAFARQAFLSTQASELVVLNNASREVRGMQNGHSV